MTDNPFDPPQESRVGRPRQPMTPAEWALIVMATLIALSWLYLLGLL